MACGIGDILIAVLGEMFCRLRLSGILAFLFRRRLGLGSSIFVSQHNGTLGGLHTAPVVQKSDTGCDPSLS